MDYGEKGNMETYRKLLDDVIKGLKKGDFPGRWCEHYTEKCDWKSYGFFQFDLAFIYVKSERKGEKKFMPKSLKELWTSNRLLTNKY